MVVVSLVMTYNNTEVRYTTYDKVAGEVNKV